jgi:hypothetical protein
MHRYKCPNGHLYTVGACTYPMEERVCTAQGCNAKIGGTNHVANAKNKRISLDDSSFNGTPGYHTSVSNDGKEKLCLSNRIIRLLIHGLIVASMEIKHAQVSSNNNVAKAMSHTRTSGFYIEEVNALFAKDFMKIKKSTGYTDDDTSMGLHLALSAFSSSVKNRDFDYSHQMQSHLIRLVQCVEACCLSKC